MDKMANYLDSTLNWHLFEADSGDEGFQAHLSSANCYCLLKVGY